MKTIGDDGMIEDMDDKSVGISEVEAPPQVLQFSDEFNDYNEIGEDYYLSLFNKCDTFGIGIVKVSCLLNMLKQFQALDKDLGSRGLDNSSYCTEEIDELKGVLDPSSHDPNISLNTFKSGVTTYLKKRDWSCLSPIKQRLFGVSMDGELDSPGPLSSSPQRVRQHFDLDISDISMSTDTGNGFSIEAFAGATPSTSFDEGRDWQAEISDLQLQLQKLNKDNDNLKKRVKEAQEENFNLFRTQRDEMNQQDVIVRVNSVRVQRLESEVNEKKASIASLEDKVTVLGHSNARLENQCSAYQREKKELVTENEELKAEVKRTLGFLIARDDTINKQKAAHTAAIKERECKVKWLNERNEALTLSLQQLEEKVITLEEERLEQENRICVLKKAEIQKNSPRHVKYAHQDSFEMDISSDDIQTELMNAGVEQLIHPSSPLPSFSFKERFDVAVQCDVAEKVSTTVQCSLLKEVVAPALLGQLVFIANEIREILISVHPRDHQFKNGVAGGCGNDEGTVVDGNGQVSAQTRVLGSNGTHHSASANDDQDTTNVVKEIHEELLEFRDQLKKSQELLHLLRYQSTQSISLTKSCPGLPIDPSNGSINSGGAQSGEGNRNKSVSIAIQTDSPEVETPLLAQKLYLISANNAKLPEHHLIGGLEDSLENHSSFDKLSDDGSVRVRDDLSMVLEVSEQETEANPGETYENMSFDRGNSLGGGRPRLRRGKAEEEDLLHHQQQTSSSSREMVTPGSGASNEKSHKDDDYVSVTSSQAESIYLSLERPLKVTITSSNNSVRGGEDDGSSGVYRSCASSANMLIGSGSIGRASNKRASVADSDTASVVSEGNTTFGSPFSSPSSPYWTPSQGSSSQETLTPLDGNRTPVNSGEIEFNSASENCSPMSSKRGFHPQAEPSGRIPDNKMETMMEVTYNAPWRQSHPDANCLTVKEWQKLREDIDQKHREIYKKAAAQEEGNEDTSGAVGSGTDGGAAFPASQYAFAHDEEAELYLEVLPDLAERLFKALNVLREKEESPSQQDLQDLERKFNNMANVFQTEHTSLEQRMNSLTKNLKESQDSLKFISLSIKSCLDSLNQFSKCNGTGVPAEDLLEVTKTLSNISDEFELYSTTACRNARRLGMMDVQNRLHKMMDVMILYVHIIRTKYDNLTSDHTSLTTDFTRVRELLNENNIPFVSAHAASSSHQLNNNDEKCLWDEDEIESNPNERGYEEESEEPEKFYQLQHLLGPKKSSAGLNRNKERLNPREKKSSDYPLIRYFNEVIRRELFWPWNTEQTMKYLKQGFAVMLMVLGISVFLRVFLPSVSAIDNSGCGKPSNFKSAELYFKSCGQLNHEDVPVI